ncbi:hypothetical protein FRB94_013282 [Tulasnella sp. JGI-2019a]|nr:hypothetical protein FRB93_007957 [Tulasnella sp. JGI-2019a]KAG8990577.1 hypothetical protein FRB94_013282 [Tulasnella sp. JGI-2019a]KAG9030826.1 hypothetical protein FRB95_003518 [Tulasnella sp. JGI-2019a]
MAGKKKVKAAPGTSPEKPTKMTAEKPLTSKEATDSALPLARYTSILGTQCLLLLFTAFYLPRSTTALLGTDFIQNAQHTSLDRPQHPFLEPLTASPTLTLIWLCGGVAAIVFWWAGYMRVWAKSLSIETKEDVRDVRAGLYKGRSAAIRGAVTTTIVAIPAFYFSLVLFGAPLTSHCVQTLLLSILLSSFVIYTPVYSLGVPSWSATTSPAMLDRLNYVRLFSEVSTRSHLDRALVYPVLGTLVGCWLGAIPLPLDWDRPWQAWPLVPAYTAILGHISGSVFSLGTSVVLTLAEYDKQQEHQKAKKD